MFMKRVKPVDITRLWVSIDYPCQICGAEVHRHCEGDVVDVHDERFARYKASRGKRLYEQKRRIRVL